MASANRLTRFDLILGVLALFAVAVIHRMCAP